MSVKKYLKFGFEKKLAQYWHDAPLSTKALFVVILPLCIMLSSLAYLYSQEQKSGELEQKLFVALKNQRNIQSISIQLNEASVAVRNFLLTKDSGFIKKFSQYEAEIEKTTLALSKDLETSSQKQNLILVKKNIDQNIDALKNMTDEKFSHRSEDLADLFYQQILLYQKIRDQLNQMAIQQSELVEKDYLKINQERQYNLNLTLLAVLACVLGVILGALIFSVTIVKRIRFLRDSASHLAKGEIIDIGTQTHDELGNLSHELSIASRLLASSVYESHQAREEAEAANAAKSMFLSRTSHELRTPLNTIIGFSSVLENDLKNENSLQNLNMIQKASKHLLKLIDELLDIARIEKGEMDINLVPVEIEQLVKEAVHYIKPLGSINDISIETEVEPNIFALADAQKLLQVLLNLLSNAIKYGPAASLVKVKAYRTQKTIHIEVLDQGKGIAEHLRSRLFTPFDRIGAENSKIEGSGLGLALSKQMMIAMHGDITASKRLSLFKLQIPAAEPLQVAKSNEEIPPQDDSITNPSKKVKLLCVEDNKSNLALIEAIIKRHHSVQLLASSNIKQTKALLKERTPDIILLDLNLPDGHGTEILEYVRQQKILSLTKVWILTADATEETKAKMMKLGADEFFTKPLDVSLFNFKLKQHMQA
jgi:signal transduction histidine kinase/ActR/RegA family two-component response regulator